MILIYLYINNCNHVYNYMSIHSNMFSYPINSTTPPSIREISSCTCSCLSLLLQSKTNYLKDLFFFPVWRFPFHFCTKFSLNRWYYVFSHSSSSPFSSDTPTKYSDCCCILCLLGITIPLQSGPSFFRVFYGGRIV